MNIYTAVLPGVSTTVKISYSWPKYKAIIRRHNELRDLEAQMLNLVCHDVEIEPVLQENTGESLAKGANTAPDARLDIHAGGFGSKQGSTFFDVRVYHPNGESYEDLSPQQIYRQHEN